MLPAEGSIITANYVPNAGKATASAFRKWDEVLSGSEGFKEILAGVGLNKGAQQNVGDLNVGRCAGTLRSLPL
jgi:hypothetical protein